MLDYEKKFCGKIIAGIDEAGRGPLAVPVVCACVVMDPFYRNDEIRDSKQLSAAVRERLFDEIIKNCLSYGVSAIDNQVIDEINILNATKKGMLEAYSRLKVKPEVLLIDAVRLEVDVANEAIIYGDELSFNIAAASIIAKVTRDRIMEDCDKLYPGYFFAKHKGYATREHISILREKGPTAIHRRSFIKNYLYEQCKLW